MLLLDKLSPYETRRVVQLGFTAVIMLVLLYAITSLYQIRASTNGLTDIVEIDNAKITYLYVMRDAIRQRQIILNHMLSTSDPFLREEMSLEFFSVAGIFRQAREKLQQLSSGQQEKLLLNELVRLIRVAQPINQNAVSSMVNDFGTESAHEISQRAQVAQLGLMQVMEELILVQKQHERKFVDENKQTYEKVFFWSVLSAIFLITLAAVISRIVSEFVSQKNYELIQKNTELEAVSELALEATRTKSTFLATMSHEIRTPLTAIIGFAEINLHDSITKEDRIRHSQSIVRNGRHLLQVINDILDISKLEADRIEFEKESFSPINLFQEVEQIIGPQAKTKGLFLEFSYDYPIPEYIIGDSLRLKQVILNLCSNAVKFTESGRIIIKTSCDFKGQKLYIEVTDTGIGMTEDQVKKVFEVFTQADSTITRKYGGTGLGLALSKQLAEGMGGEIQADSLPGVGSRFTVSINTGDVSSVKTIQKKPKKPSDLKTESRQQRIVKQVAGKILLAEDNVDNQQLFTLLLEKTGAEIKIASNGSEAVEMAMNETFDLIFMDMQMPVMDGVEATKILRRNGYNGVIISLTANAMQQDRDACFEAGSNDYITKPVSEEYLHETVYQYLNVIGDKSNSQTNIREDATNSSMQEIRKKFITNLPVKFKIIKEAFEKKHLNDVKSEIHKLKGLGTSFGHPEITEISVAIEQSLERNDTYQCENLLDNLEKMIDLAEKGAAYQASQSQLNKH